MLSSITFTLKAHYKGISYNRRNNYSMKIVSVFILVIVHCYRTDLEKL